MAEVAINSGALRSTTPLARAELATTSDETPRDETVSDTDLISLIALGGPESMQALEKLFMRHSKPIHAFLCRSLRSDQEAEDLVHDVFIKIAESAGTFRGRSSVRTWLFTLAMNQLRSCKRRASVAERAEMNLVRPGERGRVSDPTAVALQRELMGKIDAAIAELSESERETFLLYWFGEMSYAEICEATGLSVPAAKVRVHRALAKLSVMLQGLR